MKKRMIPLALSAIIALSAQSYAKSVELNIASQPLSSALSKLAEQSGMSLLVSQDVVAGKTAPALKGAMEPSAALAKLLAGTDLEASTKDGTITVRKAEGASEQSLEKITLAGTQEAVVKPKEGSAEAGYKVSSVKNVGPWGEKKLLDTPYSINVISNDLINNTQMSSPDQLIRMNPLLALNLPTSLNARPKFNIRGFTGLSNIYEDGLYNFNGWVSQLEDVEQIEVLTGLSGFLYGVGNVGGLINYAHKAPLLTQQSEVVIGDAGGESYFASADVGGPLNQSKTFRYRLNAVKQNGNTAIDNQNLDRYLVSGSLEWEPISDLIFGINASKQHYDMKGIPASWSIGSLKHTDITVPEASKLWSQTWSYNTLDTDKIGTNFKWKISDNFKLRGAYSDSQYEQDQISMVNTVLSSSTYKQSFSDRAPRTLYTKAGAFFLDSTFFTGDIKHSMTLGTQFDDAKWVQHIDSSYSGNTITSGASLASPLYVSMPSYSIGTNSNYTSFKASRNNIMLSDNIDFSDSLSFIFGINRASITQKSYLTTGVENQAGHYDDSKATPSFAFIYKPFRNVSTYVSYIESLEQGLIVPTGSLYTNSGEALPPMKSKQYEIGTKIDFENVLLTTALFQIDKANQYQVNNTDGTRTYVQDGLQVNKGIEVTLSGKLTDNLTLVGGSTLMQAKVKDQANNPLFEGNRPIDVAEKMFKLYSEYNLPGINGLTLTGGIYYTGDFYANGLNTDKLPAVTTADIGARYIQMIDGYKTAFKINITNLTDKSYWVSSNYVGDPRSVLFSASIKF
ncbi:TonB-dependent receptor [Sulfuricurvum sp.]|uniref:TonB-dependent receptor n=1 Tax=Sulfuricurvum sp. TaxID=2025608 RepID=UPI0026140D94|nr:TonB-dependent receptor [Sulfuricurvum sp.]MDD3597718.1 TonB-dependent receptor [Sulfuricurvum sp.]